MKKRDWTTTEELYLVQHYPMTPNAVLAEKLGRTIDALQFRARNLGLRKSPNYVKPNHGGTPAYVTPRTLSFAIRVIEKYGNRNPSCKELMEDFGLSRSSAYRWAHHIKAARGSY